MLIFGDKDYGETPNLFNLSSSVEKGVRLNNLIPPFYIEEDENKSFDIFYANYIVTNDEAFKELMTIIYNMYLGNTVYVLVSFDNDYSIMVYESLIKFIQQRYGYNTFVVNEQADLDAVDPDESDFTIQGLYQLDIDKERFTSLVVDIEALQKENSEDNGYQL